MPDPLRTDLLITWLAAAGAFSLVIHILRASSRSLIERRSVLLLLVLGSFCLAHGLEWLLSSAAWTRMLVVITSAPLPLALALFAEGLLRRHLPLWMKGLVAAASVVALVGVLLSPERVSGLAQPFGILVLIVVASLCVFLLRRDAHRLSLAENDLIVTCVGVATIGVPVVAIEIFADAGVFPVRTVGLAVLAFTYVLARMTVARNRPRRLVWDVAWRLLETAVLAGAIMLATGVAGAWSATRIVSLALALVLFVEIWERIAQRLVIRDDRGLVQALAGARLTSLESFLGSLQGYRMTEEHLLLGAADLDGYSPAVLGRAFASERPVCSAAQLRYARTAAGGEQLDAVEQMLDLLARYEMTHACLLAEDPMRLLLVNLPDVAGSEDAELELEVIQRCGSVAIAMEASDARAS